MKQHAPTPIPLLENAHHFYCYRDLRSWAWPSLHSKMTHVYPIGTVHYKHRLLIGPYLLTWFTNTRYRDLNKMFGV